MTDAHIGCSVGTIIVGFLAFVLGHFVGPELATTPIFWEGIQDALLVWLFFAILGFLGSEISEHIKPGLFLGVLYCLPCLFFWFGMGSSAYLLLAGNLLAAMLGVWFGSLFVDSPQEIDTTKDR